MTTTTPPADVVELLRSEDGFLITSHVDADADSVGSTLALRRMLRSLGKSCVAVVPTPLPPLLDFLPDVTHLLVPGQVSDGSWRHLIVLDCGVERTGGVAAWAPQAHRIVNIDHHATNAGTGSHNWVDPSYAATAQMVAALGTALGAAMDKETAELLYAGLVGDTGWFRFSNTTPQVLRLAADLLGQGVDVERINRNLNERHSLAYVRLLGHVLQNVRTSSDGRVVYARVTRAMRDAAGAAPTEGDGFVQYLKMIRDVDVVVLFDEADGETVRVQFRSSPRVDVAAIAQALGGGGHARAAGAKLAGTVDEVEEKVLQTVAARLAGLDGQGGK